MHRTCISLVLTTATLVACPGLAAASERYEDAVGDATGDSPDIVAVTVSEASTRPGLSRTRGDRVQCGANLSASGMRGGGHCLSSHPD